MLVPALGRARAEPHQQDQKQEPHATDHSTQESGSCSAPPAPVNTTTSTTTTIRPSHACLYLALSTVNPLSSPCNISTKRRCFHFVILLALITPTMISTRLPFRIAAIARNTRQAPISSIFAARFLASRNIIRPTVAVRTYATPGRPKKGSVGATATRRKTVTKTTSKAKKPTAKKTPARKVKTEAQKQKELLQKEKAKAKKAATAERLQKQKKARAVKEKDTKARNHLRELKATALSPPSQTAGSAYIMFYKAKMANEPGRLHSVGLRTYAKEVSSEYKALSGSELEVCHIRLSH